MFFTTRIGVAVIVLLGLTTISHGQTTVWLSDNATFSDLDITTAAPPGTTGSFDIWIKTEPSRWIYAVGLDLMAVGEAIKFTGADIVIGRDRFVFQGNPTVMDDGATISNMWAYTGLGGGPLGIGRGSPVDDEALGAYRFATVHYRLEEMGVSHLQLKVGEWLFGAVEELETLQLGIGDPITENVAGATDIVIDGRIRVVPEPGSLSLWVIGTMLLSKRCV